MLCKNKLIEDIEIKDAVIELPLDNNDFSDILKRKKTSLKNPFIKPYEYEISNQNNTSKENNSSKLFLKSFKEYLKQLEQINLERTKNHIKWLHFLRSDETSEDGSP